jgi:predicted Rossmann fold flavoprotein
MRNVDVAIIGAGAAGLTAAAFASRRLSGCAIVALDGAPAFGAKLLVTGGGRCNLSNAEVAAEDFNGGSPHIIGRILNSFSVPQTLRFFQEIGVDLHEEQDGKIFPDSNRARTVCDALLSATQERGVQVMTASRVTRVAPAEAGFRVDTVAGALLARCVVLATGGRSLPQTGSDGAGYSLAISLGHTLVPTTPALVPLILEGDCHTQLSGISQPVEISVSRPGIRPRRFRGELLWTHFGISGPAVLNASRHWHRARLEEQPVTVTANLLPNETFESAERKVLGMATNQPRLALRNALSEWLPTRVADAVLTQLQISRGVPLAHLSRGLRRRLLHALLNWPLPVVDSRGYDCAEVTAGGIPLSEIDPATMESRKQPSLFLAGEILDVDGRLGGFNLQWAWSSAWVASCGLERRLR